MKKRTSKTKKAELREYLNRLKLDKGEEVLGLVVFTSEGSRMLFREWVKTDLKIKMLKQVIKDLK